MRLVKECQGIDVAKKALKKLADIAKLGLEGNALLRALCKWSMDTSRMIVDDLRDNEGGMERAGELLKDITGVNVLGTVQEQMDVDGLADILSKMDFGAVDGSNIINRGLVSKEAARHRVVLRTCVNGKAVRR